MVEGKFRIISNKRVSTDCYRLEIFAPEISKEAKPGQFVHVLIKEKDQKPLLRRPFAVHNVKDKETLYLLYKIRGVGTKALSSMKKDDTLDIIGPLGNGFDAPGGNKKALVVGGGIGIAPLLFLIKELIERGRQVTTFIGADCEDNLLLGSEIDKLNSEVIITTEDGSSGKQAKVTDVLADYLGRNKEERKAEIFASGPKEMLRVIAKLAQKHHLASQVSLDEIIACGVGACLGCAVKTRNGYKLVCKDGPVFKTSDLLWE
jgi:dihydroorotate dehydrogenase electron transfer subunit